MSQLGWPYNSQTTVFPMYPPEPHSISQSPIIRLFPIASFQDPFRVHAVPLLSHFSIPYIHPTNVPFMSTTHTHPRLGYPSKPQNRRHKERITERAPRTLQRRLAPLKALIVGEAIITVVGLTTEPKPEANAVPDAPTPLTGLPFTVVTFPLVAPPLPVVAEPPPTSATATGRAEAAVAGIAATKVSPLH